MNCDQAFAVLTGGPFPRGDAHDGEVEQHLSYCPTCWRIAEALRPAADVFEESLPAAERRQLPVFRSRQLAPVQAGAAHATPRATRPATHASTLLTATAPRRYYQSLALASHLPAGESPWLDTARAMTIVGVAALLAASAGWWWQ